MLKAKAYCRAAVQPIEFTVSTFPGAGKTRPPKGAWPSIWAKNLRNNALHSLTVGYPSHGFVIDRREAGELFKKVREPNQHEAALIETLGHIAGHPGNEPLVMYLNSEDKVNETDNSKNGDSQGTKEKANRKASSS